MSPAPDGPDTDITAVYSDSRRYVFRMCISAAAIFGVVISYIDSRRNFGHRRAALGGTRSLELTTPLSVLTDRTECNLRSIHMSQIASALTLT